MNMCLEPYDARYLDPKTSRWISADPAMGDYIPGAPINDEVRKRNVNLPGMGGVFNVVNLHTYHYAGNNPLKYMDPDGRDIDVSNLSEEQHAKYLEAFIKLTETDQGRYILSKLVTSDKTYTIKMNNEGLNGYDPKSRTIDWDPSIAAIAGDEGVLTPTLLLGHELGHAFLNETNSVRGETLLDIENQNVEVNENPIAKQLGLGVRKDHHDWAYSFSSDSVNSKNRPSPEKILSANIIYLYRLLEKK